MAEIKNIEVDGKIYKIRTDDRVVVHRAIPKYPKIGMKYYFPYKIILKGSNVGNLPENIYRIRLYENGSEVTEINRLGNYLVEITKEMLNDDGSVNIEYLIEHIESYKIRNLTADTYSSDFKIVKGKISYIGRISDKMYYQSENAIVYRKDTSFGIHEPEYVFYGVVRSRRKRFRSKDKFLGNIPFRKINKEYMPVLRTVNNKRCMTKYYAAKKVRGRVYVNRESYVTIGGVLPKIIK